MKKINFLFGIHNHQPVGNFQHVFEDSYRKGYLPFLELLKKYPKVKTTIHFSGILLAWIRDNHPETIMELKSMVASGQLEMMTGGFYEPILPTIPDRDKLCQIKKLTGFIRDNFDYESKGLWLAERVWEPHLPKVLNQAGVKYTILDDTHFKYSGLEDADLNGYYLTEEEGHTLALFPISKTLRYTIPFRKPAETIDYLRSVATEKGDQIAVYADDGEKFGVWPGTYKHCFTEKWLEKFFKLLSDNSDWINILHFSEALKTLPPRDRVYLPTASYMEMTEWALPANAIEKYEKVVDHFKKNNLWDNYHFFVRGGFWRNFLAKYPESNNMHKKMLSVSRKINTLSKESGSISAGLNDARDYLQRGQCNCPYWHGVFGGLYLPHVRSAIYQNLIMAEKLVDQMKHQNRDWSSYSIYDFDRDGHDELVAESTQANYYFKPNQGAQIFELDYKPENLNIVDTITRQKEGYHCKIKQAVTKGEESKDSTVSIHDVYRSKEKGLEKLLSYDWYRRGMFIDHFFKDDVDMDAFSRSVFGEEGDFVNQPFTYETKQVAGDLVIDFKRMGGVWYQGAHAPVHVQKQFIILSERPEMEVNYVITNHHNTAIKLWYGLELNFGFPNIGSPNVRYIIESDSGAKGLKLNSTKTMENIRDFGIYNPEDNFRLEFLLKKRADLWRFPVHSVSLSEGGFEKVQQGICLLPSWKFRLDSGESWKMKVQVKFKELVSSPSSSIKQLSLVRA
jgi:4-alpha-glucanotransferase